MKTIKEFFYEIENSEQLMNELKEIRERPALEEFLKRNDCSATAEEYLKFIISRKEGELTDDQAESAAGGRIWDTLLDIASL